MYTTNWLQELARESLGDFEVTETIDLRLSGMAVRAWSDEGAAFDLLRMLAWKIARFVRRFRSWDIEPFDLDDVAQESYFVYLETLRRWMPNIKEGRPSGYLHYFLCVFPRWLGNAVRRWQRPARPPTVRVTECQDGEEAIAAEAAIRGFCRNLSSEDAMLVQLRLVEGFSVPRAAQTMGIARRTAYRRWRRILVRGREYLREVG